MKTLSTILSAGALALSLGGFAFAADEPADGRRGAAVSGRPEEVRVAAGKPSSRQCIDAAKKKFGQM